MEVIRLEKLISREVRLAKIGIRCLFSRNVHQLVHHVVFIHYATLVLVSCPVTEGE